MGAGHFQKGVSGNPGGRPLVTALGKSTKSKLNGKAKLTEEDVIAIRAENRTLQEIGADYGVYFTMIGMIKRRERWAHI